MIANRPRFLVPVVVAAAFAAPLAAGAQTPSYATRSETIRGTISSVQNVNHLFVEDDRGYTDDVTLRSGAAVVSNGVRLEPGQRVTIQGAAAGKTFLATRISTNGRSYTADAATSSATYPVPVPDYYAASAYYYSPPVYYSYSPYFYSPYFYGYFRSGYSRSFYRRPYYGGYRPYYGYGGYRPYYGYGGYRGYHPVSIGVRVRIR